MLEAVIRVCASCGLPSMAILLFGQRTYWQCPLCPGSSLEVQIEEAITTVFVVFQTAVLHTTCYGERHILVITLALPTTTNLSEVFASADQVAITTFLANKAVEQSLTNKLEDS